MHHLTIYSANDCCLCDDARDVLVALQQHLDFDFEEIKIDGDPVLEAKWRSEIPVGILDGRKVFKYKVDTSLLTRRLAAKS